MILLSLSLCVSSQIYSQELPDRYIRDIQKISDQYNTDMKMFMRVLDPQISEFQPQQKKQFCEILKKYVDDFYQTTDQNRDKLPFSYAKMTKQDVIAQVLASKELTILSKYKIECDLN